MEQLLAPARQLETELLAISDGRQSLFSPNDSLYVPYAVGQRTAFLHHFLNNELHGVHSWVKLNKNAVQIGEQFWDAINLVDEQLA
jgi:hypothetical protein